jgi:hypothetical protein
MSLFIEYLEIEKISAINLDVKKFDAKVYRR